MTAATAPHLGRGRRAAVRLLGVLGLLGLSLMPLSVVMEIRRADDPAVLEQPGSEAAVYGVEHPGEEVHLVGAAALLVLGAVGLGTLIVRPDHAGAAIHSAAVATAFLAVTLIVGNPNNYGGQAGVIDIALLALAVPALAAALLAAPWRRWDPHPRSLKVAGLAVLGAPALIYGVAQALLQRTTWPPLADPHHQAHWLVMAVVAFAAVALVAGAGLGGRGWRMAASSGGVAAVVVGGASVWASSAASAPAWPAAVAAVAWGVAVVAVAQGRGLQRRP